MMIEVCFGFLWRLIVAARFRDMTGYKLSEILISMAKIL